MSAVAFEHHRNVVSLVLSTEGFLVTTARDGCEALGNIAQAGPALVLLDLNMPLMTGWNVLVHFQQAQAGIPVVFMTAAGSGKAEAERWHADGYVAKPFDLDELLTVVEHFLPGAAA